jgi:IS5 family transposase
VEKKLLRSRRLRVDCTAMEADVRYPTDSGLCAHAISRIGRAVKAAKSAGLALRTRFRNRRRSAAKLVRKLSLGLGRPGSQQRVLKHTSELRDLAQATLRQARRVLANARRKAPRAGRKGKSAATQLAHEIERAERVIEQTTRRLAGEAPIVDRVVSLCDRDARPIRRGKPQKPTEFGYKVALGDTPEGFVVAHQVHMGNPGDTDTLRPLLQQAKAIGMRVRTLFADRGFGNEVADAVIQAEAIPDKVIPRVGKAAPAEATRSWRRRYRWRAGCEGRISHLKRRYGLKRTRLKGYGGAQIWAGYGVLASNLDRMAALAG